MFFSITNHGTVDDTNLYQTLNIKIGARVMLVLNVNTTDSLVNGSIGIVLDIIKNNEGKVTCIIIKFDSDKSGAEQRRHPIAVKYKEENGTPIFRQKIKYHLGGAGKKKHAANNNSFSISNQNSICNIRPQDAGPNCQKWIKNCSVFQ